MDEKKYLNEEKYQKTEKSITVFAILILVVGLLIGGFLIYRGIAKPATSKVDVLEKNLKEKRNELISKGIEYDESSEYTDGEKYDLYIITKALDPSFQYCEFDEYKNNSITKEYCAAKNSISEFSNSTSIMFGAFICFATIVIFTSVFTSVPTFVLTIVPLLFLLLQKEDIFLHLQHNKLCLLLKKALMKWHQLLEMQLVLLQKVLKMA